MPLRLALTLLLLAGCAPGVFDDLRNSVREDAGQRTVDVDRDSGDAEDTDSATGEEASGAGAKRATAGRSSGGAGGTAAGSGGRAAGSGSAETSGSGGNAGGESGAAGAGSGGGVSGTAIPPAAAGAGGTPPACGDTTTDPHHCGSCAHDCGTATSADVSCLSSKCETRCRAGFADCDGDLAQGASGTGCETATSTDLAHCGGCGNRCPQPATGIAACELASCVVHTSKIGAGSAVSATPHGSVGGQAYNQTCPVGEALVGLDVATTGDIAYGFNVLCAPLILGGTSSAPVFTTGTVHAPLTAIGGIIDPVPPVVRFACPANTVVAGVAGVTYIWTDGMRTSAPSIRSISLACNEVALDAQRRLSFTPKMVIDIGDREDQFELYTDVCPVSQVVVGFKGYAGAFVDGLQTYCGLVSIE